MDDKYDGATPADTQTTQVPKRDEFSEAIDNAMTRMYKRGYQEGYQDGFNAGYENGHKIGRMDGHNAAAQHCIDAKQVDAASLLVSKFNEIQ